MLRVSSIAWASSGCGIIIRRSAKEFTLDCCGDGSLYHSGHHISLGTMHCHQRKQWLQGMVEPTQSSLSICITTIHSYHFYHSHNHNNHNHNHITITITIASKTDKIIGISIYPPPPSS